MQGHAGHCPRVDVDRYVLGASDRGCACGARTQIVSLRTPCAHAAQLPAAATIILPVEMPLQLRQPILRIAMSAAGQIAGAARSYSWRCIAESALVSRMLK